MIQADRRAAERPHAKTVLVVDDSVAMRRILSRALLDAGYAVVVAADGREGVEVCRRERPDLVLLDVDMPVMDGHAALREMKADDELADVPVLFLTARTSGTDVVAGLELGAEDYVRKPCEPAELVARVATVMRRREQELQLARHAELLDELSMTDALTRIPNRRRFDVFVEGLGDGASVGFLMIDVDRFKQVNDTEGHQVGDLVLSIVARRLQSVVESQHLLVRWGGEEFVVLTVDTPPAEVADVAERLRQSVEDEPVSVSSAKQLAVTVSVGGACGSVRDLVSVTRAADEAVYEAKRTGRNRVVFR